MKIVLLSVTYDALLHSDPSQARRGSSPTYAAISQQPATVLSEGLPYRIVLKPGDMISGSPRVRNRANVGKLD